MGRRITFVIAAWMLAACAGKVASPAPPPESAVPELRASAPDVLGLDDVAAEALDVDALARLLDDAGFVSGIERTYTGPGAAIRRVDVRVLRFATSGGAERYRAWLGAHARDLIGNAAPSPPDVAGTLVFLHRPDPCCPRETAVALAVWRHDRDVLRVVVAGPGADAAATAEVVSSLSGWMDAA